MTSGTEISQAVLENDKIVMNVRVRRRRRSAKEGHCFTSCSQQILAMRPWTCKDKATDNRMSEMRYSCTILQNLVHFTACFLQPSHFHLRFHVDVCFG